MAYTFYVICFIVICGFIQFLYYNNINIYNIILVFLSTTLRNVVLSLKKNYLITKFVSHKMSQLIWKNTIDIIDIIDILGYIQIILIHISTWTTEDGFGV